MKSFVLCFALMFCCASPLAYCDPTNRVGPGLQAVSVNVLAGTAQGSGTIFLTLVEGKPAAFVITAYHVIDGLRSVESIVDSKGSSRKIVTYQDAQIIQERVLNGRIVGELKFDAIVINADKRRDIALLRVRDGEFTDIGADFYLDAEIPCAGTELYHCGAPGGKGTGGTCSLTMGIVSRIGVRIPDFGGGSKHGVFDQTDTAALGGSSGGLLALKTDGRFIGMITLGLRGGDNFHWYVPARAFLKWSDQIGCVWLFDSSLDRPTEKDIEGIPLENLDSSREPTPAK